jgi:hypothetical protein
LVESGIAIFAATGNDAGLYGDAMGIYSASSPGTGLDVFAVGSNGRNLKYYSVFPLDGPVDRHTVLVVNYGSDSELNLTECLQGGTFE